MNSKRHIKMFENKKLKVVKISKTEFELDNGDIFPLPFEFDEELTVEEFQKILDDSKNVISKILKRLMINE